MPAGALQKILTDRRFLSELHHLLWRPPFMNKGTLDAGWMCREHALMVAGMGVLNGCKSTIVWGALSLVGENETGGRSIVELETHSWAGIKSFGFIDLSLNLDRVPDTNWRKWPGRYLLGAKFYPGQGVRYRQFSVDEQAQWRFEAQAAIGIPGYHALYLGKSYEDLTADFLGNSVEYINSPLADDLRKLKTFDGEIYVKALRRLWAVANKTGRPLLRLSQIDAWNSIAAAPPALEWFAASVAAN